MPSTLRVVIAAKNANAYVERNLDDVLNSNFGRSVTLDFVLGVEQQIAWPATGETFVYFRFPQLNTGSYQITFASVGSDAGFSFVIPEAVVDVNTGSPIAGSLSLYPLLLPMPVNEGGFAGPTLLVTSSVTVPGVEAVFI